MSKIWTKNSQNQKRIKRKEKNKNYFKSEKNESKNQILKNKLLISD
jgi:hypothetical protein